jgi:hypothetical protein
VLSKLYKLEYEVVLLVTYAISTGDEEMKPLSTEWRHRPYHSSPHCAAGVHTASDEANTRL